MRALFLDIGNFLLSNGWNRRMRQAAVEKFNLDEEEMEGRHQLTF
jgi:putative hydrolase of the HAD superfamily